MNDAPFTTSAPSATITRCPRRVQALFAGHLLADSGDVLVLRQAGQTPVHFFARKDVEMAVLREGDCRARSTLGEARCFTIVRDGQIVEDVARCYVRPEAPYQQLAGRIAFQTDHVEVHETDLAADESASFEGANVDEVVRHTDSGAGFSQEAAWEPTVSTPSSPDPDKPYSGVGAI
ncbi:MAG: hypothetical protein BGN86_13875 [Caulobacterales bacterium 68-7]|nr:DUF427 domain-containing protein [Caulobacterales bacterium]OJU11935.1 MAG: hypothetical protein BGN86_13875 [Caulobacterales bacterium 68-7]